MGGHAQLVQWVNAGVHEDVVLEGGVGAATEEAEWVAALDARWAECEEPAFFALDSVDPTDTFVPSHGGSVLDGGYPWADVGVDAAGHYPQFVGDFVGDVDPGKGEGLAVDEGDGQFDLLAEEYALLGDAPLVAHVVEGKAVPCESEGCGDDAHRAKGDYDPLSHEEADGNHDGEERDPKVVPDDPGSSCAAHGLQYMRLSNNRHSVGRPLHNRCAGVSLRGNGRMGAAGLQFHYHLQLVAGREEGLEGRLDVFQPYEVRVL